MKVSCLKDAAKGSLAITVSPQDCLNSSYHVRNDMKLFNLLDWPRKTHLDILRLKASILTIDFGGIKWDLCCWMGSWSHWQHPRKQSRRKQCPLHKTQNVLQRNKGIVNVVAPCKHLLEWLKGCGRCDLYCCKLSEEISGDFPPYVSSGPKEVWQSLDPTVLCTRRMPAE